MARPNKGQDWHGVGRITSNIEMFHYFLLSSLFSLFYLYILPKKACTERQQNVKVFFLILFIIFY